MRVAIAQLNYTVGAFSRNLEKVARAVEVARGQHADLVVLTELATTGYPPGDLLERRDFIDRNLDQLKRYASLSDERLGILAGFVDRNTTGSGKPLHNAVALCHRGRVVDSYHKSLLPTYDVFDEDRYFEPGTRQQPMVFRGVPIGVSVCEDLWSDPHGCGSSRYRHDPVMEQVTNGAKLLVNLSASPFELGKAGERRELIQRYARESGRFLVYANQVGGNDELVFDGHSMIVDGSGRMVARARDFQEDLLVYEVPNHAAGDLAGVAGPLGVIGPVADSFEATALAALELGLRDYVRKCGFERVVLGLSGGIDSAVVAAIAARALGPENVLGVAMPTRYSSGGSVRDARALAENLGIDLQIVPIDQVFQAYLDCLAPVFRGHGHDVTEENLQARIRGAILMAISNKFGQLVLTTGNKSESAVGYATLYGDMCGGLAPISDVPKTLVYKLADHLNRQSEVVPAATISKPPSAELRPGQTDQDSLPDYPILDAVVTSYVEDHRSMGDIIAGGANASVVRQVVHLIDSSEYKRRQAAPGIKITSKAFGLGRRQPIAADYASLHQVG